MFYYLFISYLLIIYLYILYSLYVLYSLSDFFHQRVSHEWYIVLGMRSRCIPDTSSPFMIKSARATTKHMIKLAATAVEPAGYPN